MSSNLTNTHLVKNAVGNAKHLPNGVQVFIFGSACYCTHPNDIDILFVYDSSSLPPQSAYAALRPIMTEVEKVVGIPVHSVVLSQDEARMSGFMDTVEPVEVRSTRDGKA